VGAYAIHQTAHHPEWLPIAASVMGILGLAVSWFLYARKGANVEAALEAHIRPAWYKTIYNKFYFDEIYYSITRNFLIKGVAGFLKAFDHYIIDALGDFIAGVLQWMGRGVRLAQNGSFVVYASVLISGVVFGMWMLSYY
jgi:NADH-quinone oxidoreductase subunit L